MKEILLMIVLVFSFIICLGQKKSLDTSVFNNWPFVENPALSNDGNFATYDIVNKPVGQSTLVLVATDSSWCRKIIGGRRVQFSEDSRNAFLMTANDSLAIIVLGTDSIMFISNVKSFKISHVNNSDWLIYHSNKSDNLLTIINILSNTRLYIDSVLDYNLDETGNNLVIKKASKDNNGLSNCLNFVNILTGKIVCFWKGIDAKNIVFDESGSLVAFCETSNNKRFSKSFWYYKFGDKRAKLLVTNEDIDSVWILDRITGFSKKGDRVFFTVNPAPGNANVESTQVDVWSYFDSKLQSQQLYDIKFTGFKNYVGVISLNKQIPILLQDRNESLCNRAQNDILGVIVQSDGDREERNWNTASCSKFFIVSKVDGKRTYLKDMDGLLENNIYMSPDGLYIIYYDYRKLCYFSYHIASGATKNITNVKGVNWASDKDDPQAHEFAIGIAGWIDKSTEVLIYDNTDIWRIDYSGVNMPENVTNRYGRNNEIQFRIGVQYDNKIVNYNGILILSAFNSKSKKNGFYRKDLAQKGDPELLVMDDAFYYAPDARTLLLGLFNSYYNFLPIKAKRESAYLVKKMNSTSSPNFYFTRDFEKFIPLSYTYPEEGYNWLTSELVEWRSVEGGVLQGILYKPVDFNKHLKYPLIVHIYEKFSDGLHLYLPPKAAQGELNIPWFVSKGYLIFTPDINYKIGWPGKSAYEAVISCTKYLSKLAFVDSNKLGIQGHSFGAYEVNYIIAHSNKFAAAMSSSGVVDFISGYSSLWNDGKSRQGIYELRQSRVGVSLWQNPKLYIENSPLFKLPQVKTPLLIMHNMKDGNVPFSQGLELFLAMRRLGKKAWMLQYDNGDHGLFDRRSEIDYTIRMQQFFDYFLKKLPPPIWMKQGIPANLKGRRNGLDYEISDTLLNKDLLIP